MRPFLHRSESILLEPLSALTHSAGALLALSGLVLLVRLTQGDTAKMVTVIIYSASLFLMYAVSAVFHGLRLPEGQRMWLNRLDHAAIFLVIAGSYTPIVYNLFPTNWRWPTLIAIWLVAIGGSLYKLFSERIHGLFNVGVYPVISWAGLAPGALAYLKQPLFPMRGIGLLLFGGAIYMIGFVVYYRRRPDPWPQIFGHHEIWHVSIMAGSLCHFLFVLWYVV
jgi:hemolysin III